MFSFIYLDLIIIRVRIYKSWMLSAELLELIVPTHWFRLILYHFVISCILQLMFISKVIISFVAFNPVYYQQINLWLHDFNYSCSKLFAPNSIELAPNLINFIKSSCSQLEDHRCCNLSSLTKIFIDLRHLSVEQKITSFKKVINCNFMILTQKQIFKYLKYLFI